MSEFDKKCSKCRNYNGNILICESCAHYKPKQTVFQRITVSPGVLAEKFIFKEWHPIARCYVWYSLLLNSEERLIYSPAFATKEEAIAATLEELNKVSK